MRWGCYNFLKSILLQVLRINSKYLSALSYKAKALIELTRIGHALIYIKKALKIKHNKTLYKYLIELENKSSSFTIKGKIENINSIHPQHKDKENFKEEYIRIFDIPVIQVYFINEYFYKGI